MEIEACSGCFSQYARKMAEKAVFFFLSFVPFFFMNVWEDTFVIIKFSTEVLYVPKDLVDSRRLKSF